MLYDDKDGKALVTQSLPCLPNFAEQYGATVNSR